jgi:hypothetical protein
MESRAAARKADRCMVRTSRLLRQQSCRTVQSNRGKNLSFQRGRSRIPRHRRAGQTGFSGREGLCAPHRRQRHRGGLLHHAMAANSCRDADGFREEPNPTGKSVICLSSPFCKNILVFRRRKSLHIRRRPVPQRGVAQRHETRNGMRWTPGAPLTNGARGGRRSRVVLMPRRWHQAPGKQASRG